MTSAIYLATGVFLTVLGGAAAFVHRDIVRRLVALNIASGGVFLLLVATAERADADPVARALVLTGIVVAVSVTGVALVFGVRLAEHGDEGQS
ncbi:NADH-quinone oxidoreductase subunit K [Arhodomonas sp. SL1]|uniref:NADH-quinone oxidoreductase subunit K n=1 Tax=Arhodomonas sp. SL1 TaxID=3425691 RepID=UPI003F884FBB